MHPHPYLEGPYAPAGGECAGEDARILGELPSGLEGTFVRNGPEPRFPVRGAHHWFDGDGMLHAVELGGGRARHRSRWVRTRAFDAESSASRALWRSLGDGPDPAHPAMPFKDVANTDVIPFGDGVLATWWLSGEAYVVSLPGLETRGVAEIGPCRHIAAHAKRDPGTGELHFFHHRLLPPFLTYGVAAPDGRLLHHTEIPFPGPRLQHDFALTEGHALFFDFPVRLEHGAGVPRQLALRRDLPLRIGVLERGADGMTTQWLEAEPGFFFHVVNAWDDGDEIELLACRIDEPFAQPGRAPAPRIGRLRIEPRLHRWRIDLRRGAVKEETLLDDLVEFPRVDPTRLGRRTRFAYLPRVAPAETLLFEGVLRHDADGGAPRLHRFAPGWFGGEPVFVPRPGARDEDDGWLLVFASDGVTGHSELHVLDAADLPAPPLARVQLPRRVPAGFHGCWVPAAR